ncbi:hypothetical protein TNCV_4052231 [Trichonephila clavipes]|nr:hypothetical protein TNCV_4052231 [Trichonephila clavipes]
MGHIEKRNVKEYWSTDPMLETTGVACSEGPPRIKIPSLSFFRYVSPVSRTVITRVGALVAWGPNIIDTADTAVALRPCWRHRFLKL